MYRNKMRTGKIARKMTKLTAILLAALLLLGDRSLANVLAAEQNDTVAATEQPAEGEPQQQPSEDTDGEEMPQNKEGTPTIEGKDIGDGNSQADGETTLPEDGLSLDVFPGDALPLREPENFHEAPEPEDYGTLVTYDEYSRTYHVDGNQYITVIGYDGSTYLDDDGMLKPVDNTLVETTVPPSGQPIPMAPQNNTVPFPDTVSAGDAVSPYGFMAPHGAASTFSAISPNSRASLAASTTGYTNRANDYSVTLPEEIDLPAGKGITLESDGYRMTVYPAEGNFTQGTAKDNAIRYSNVLEGIDYQYTVLGNSIKEDIILLERNQKNTFSFYIDTFGLVPELVNNTLSLKDGDNEVFFLEAPEMEDAAGEISFGIKITLEGRQPNGMYLATVTADQEWLSAPERAYPVRIDPSAIQVPRSAIRIACAEQGSPNKVIGDNGYPYVGFDDGIVSGNQAGFGSTHLNTRSYFAIDYDFGSLAAEAEIVSAAFQVTQKTRWSKGTSEFGLYEVGQPWTVGSLTWNSQRDYDHYFVDSQTAKAVSGEALTYDVTEVVSSWINGTSPNNGLVMKALVESGGLSGIAVGAYMQCEVFYNNTSASYAPKLILSWTGELVDLENMGLDDTTINIYPVVARNGDKSNTTLGVVAHGLAKAGSTVTYSLVNGSTGTTEARTSLLYPDSALYSGSYPSAIAYNRRLSNWQSSVFPSLTPGQVYYITAYASLDGERGATVTSDTFLIYQEGAFDVLPRIANHYGVDLNTIMADMRMQDALTKEGNRLFIRNPVNTAPYVAGPLSDYYKAMIDGLLLGRAQDCVFNFDPINMNTGNFYLEYEDAAIADIGGDFAISRQYNSKGAAYNGSLGYGWNFTYDERLGELADGSVIWLMNTGAIITFSRDGEGYRAPDGQNYDLVGDGDGYTVTERGTGRKHIFNAYGLLTALEDIYGNRTTLSYDMDYRLFKVTSPSGKEFGITLDDRERVSSISLPDGNSVHYTYNEAGDLVSVTDPAGDTLRYVYNNKHEMTAYYDPNGNRVIYNSYDSEGRVIKQTDAENNTISLDYQPNRTIATDANGNITVYHYDDLYRTTRVEYPDGTEERMGYGEDGYRSFHTDTDGHTTSYEYDHMGNLVRETRADGATRNYTYNGDNQILTITDYDGGVTAFTYNEKGLPASITDGEGGVTRYAYDELNRLTAMTDPEGYRTSYTYEGACVTSMEDAEGHTWQYSYDTMNRLTVTVTPLGYETKTTYNKKGWLIRETDGTGATTTYTFDAAGNVTAITDREGNTSTFLYDKKNQMLSGTDPLGNALAFTYDANGNKLTETDPEGSPIAYTYDSMDRLLSMTDPEGATTAYAYDRAGNTIGETDRRGYSSRTSYDTMKKVPLQEVDREGNTTSYETDVMGRITTVIYPDGSTMAYTWDRLSRPTSLTDPLGTTTYLTYDKKGNLILLKDDDSRTYHYGYDAVGRLVKTTDPLGYTQAYTYDGAGNLVSATDQNGNVTAYTYDKAGRLTQVTDALGGKTDYTYDREGRPLSITTPNRDTTTYSYDAIGQLRKVTDALKGVTTLEYDALSRITLVTDVLGNATSLAYDRNSNLTSVTDVMGNTRTYQTDREGNLLKETYQNHETEAYTYDRNGNVLSYTDRYGIKTTLTYDTMGRVVEAEDTAGNSMAYTYDRAGNLTSQRDTIGREASYGYDAYGRVTSITDLDGAVTAYAYDALDRLVGVVQPDGTSLSYSYDGAGNLTHRTEPGNHPDDSLAVYLYTYDALHRLSGKVDPEGAATAFAYDADGNMTRMTDGNGTVTSYAYDALSRLAAYTDGRGGTTAYTYDALSRLTAITTPEGITESYRHDAIGNILSVTDGMGEATAYAYDSLYRLIEKTSPMGARETYTYDAHDIVTSVTDVLGNVTRYDVNENGKVTAITMPNGSVYAYTYDAVHRLTGITTPLGLKRELTYSIGDDILGETDNLGRKTSYTYDVMHRLTSITDPEGGLTQYAYDSRGNRSAITNALGYTYGFSYNRVDQMVTVKDPEEKVASLTYDRVGNLTSVTTPGKRTTSYEYDGNYNRVGLTDPMGYRYTYAYDLDDRLIGTKDPLGQTTSYLYDKANRLITYTDPMNLSESYLYDAHGNAIGVTATDGRITRYTYDKKDRLTSVTDPMGSVAYYTYDEMDNLTGVVNYLGQGTTYTYDIEGNLTCITDVAGRTETMGYDIAGRITSYTSNGGNTITYDYNKLNSLVEKAYTDADGEESAQPVVYAYNALGERVAMNDATGDTEYTYDGLGRITSVTTYRTQNEDGSTNRENGDTITYTYDGADNLSAIIYPDGTRVRYEYDLNDNLTEVTDREGRATSYAYDAINRVTEIHRPNGISTYNTYNGRNQITELRNVCSDSSCGCGWVVSSYSYTYDDRGFIVGETAIESLAGYAYDHKHDGKHADGRHDNLYPHGNRHNGKSASSAHAEKDADFVYQIVRTDRTFTYDGAGKLLSMVEDEENYGLYTTTFEYDLMGNRTSIVRTDDEGKVVEYRKYVYNGSSQVASAEIYDGKKTTTMDYAYDADGNLITEIGRIGTDKVETYYHYAVENRLAAVYEADNLLVAMAYDGDGNRVFQLNYNLHTDEDWKGNSGNGNGNNKDNRGSGDSGSGNSSNSSNGSSSGSSGNSDGSNGSSAGNSGNPGNSSESNKKGGNGKDNGNTGAKSIDGSTGNTGSTGNSTDSGGTGGNGGNGNTTANSTSTGIGNATNAEGNNSQNQSGILFPIGSEVSEVEQGLIDLVKTTGREKDYELIEYLNDVNRQYAEVLVEQNINGKTDTSYVYGVARLSLDRFDGSTGYYLYDPRGSVTGITNEDGKIYQSYRYGAYGEITFGAPQYENEYAYNGESYNPNIESQYLRARYYYVVTATFLTEDSYLGDIMEPLTLNRYLYCVASPLNYRDPSGYLPILLPAIIYKAILIIAGVGSTYYILWGANEYLFPDDTYPFGVSAYQLIFGVKISRNRYLNEGLQSAFDKSRIISCEENTEDSGSGQGSGSSESRNLTDKPGKIANKTGHSIDDVKDAIEDVKQNGNWRGDGNNRNPDVMVDIETGEVYPKTPNGGIGDSIGNIFDYLP